MNSRPGSFEGNCEILRTIFQPRALSADIPASRKGVKPRLTHVIFLVYIWFICDNKFR